MPADSYNDSVLDEYLPEWIRTNSPWMQIVRDLTAPAPESIYASDFTEARIRRYDGVRLFVSRAGLLATIVVIYAVMSPGWVGWLLLVPAAVQCSTEIVGYYHEERAFFMYRNQFQRTLLNTTGVIGGIAVTCLLISTALVLGPSDPPWLQLVAFLCAAAYAVSGTLTILLDATNYAESRVRFVSGFFRYVRVYVWLAVLVIGVGIVFLADQLERWEPSMVAPAYLVAITFSIFLGMQARNYDRMLRVGAEITDRAMLEARERFAQTFHDLGESAVRNFLYELNDVEEIPASIKSAANYHAANLLVLRESVNERDWIATQRHRFVMSKSAQMARVHGLNVVESRFEMPKTHTGNHKLIDDFLHTSILNAAQAYRSSSAADRPVRLSVTYINGPDDAPWIRAVVGDALGPVPPDRFCRPGSTTGELRGRLRRAGGELTQVVDDDGKSIVACWPIRRPTVSPPIRRRKAHQ